MDAMYMLFLVLNEEEYLNKVLKVMHESNVNGATIIDSKGMGSYILECESPVVGGLRRLIYNQCRQSNHTILSVVDSSEKAEKVITEIEKKVGSLEEEGKGIAFVFPVERVKGIRKSK